MATVYINPTFTVNGDGSTFTQAATPGGAGAFNAWGTGTTAGTIDLTHFWKDGTTYLQCEGTTYSTTVVVYNCIGIVIGAYDAGTGAQIHDVNRCAKIRSSDPTAFNHALALGTMGASRNTITIDSIDARHLNRTGANNHGMANSAAGGTAVAITVRNCYFDGTTGASLAGSGIDVQYSKWTGYADGFTVTSTDAIFRHNQTVYGTIDQASWDANTVIVTSLTPARIVIEDNDYTDHPETDKQGIYIYSGGTESAAPTGPVRIQRNRVGNANQCIYSACPGSIVRDNIIVNATNHNYPDGSGGDPRAISLFGAGNVVDGNVVLESDFARFLAIATTSAGANKVTNNTALGVESGITDTSGGSAHTLILQNNVIARTPQTVQPDADMRFVSTTSAATVQASNNTFYRPNGPEGLYIGSADKTWAQWIAGWDTSGLNTDPQVDATGRPVDGSPSIGTGVFVAYGADAAGCQRSNPPSRGAYEYQRARAARTLPA